MRRRGLGACLTTGKDIAVKHATRIQPVNPRTASCLFPEWRPELHFLLEHLEVAGYFRDPGSSHAFARGFDWEYLQATASRHGVLPLFFKSISKNGSASIPTPMMDRMRREYGGISQRNFIFAQEMLRLLACLNDEDIVVIPYKGAFLAAIGYGDLSLRQFSDLDILVKPTDLLRAKRLLEEQGYHARFIYGYRPLTKLTAAETETFLKYCHEYEVQRKDGLLIDLHWQLAPKHYPFRIDPGPLWARLETFDIEGRSVSSFAREDLILILCMHGAKDRWKKLIWIIDLVKIITNNPGLDWAAVSERAKHAGMELPLLLGLRLVEELFPQTVLPSLDYGPRHRDRIAGLAQTVFKSLFTITEIRECLPVKSLHVKLCRNFRDKVTYTFQGLFVPRVPDWSTIRLPSWLFPLYYLIRPLRIMAGCARASVQRLVSGLGAA